VALHFVKLTYGADFDGPDPLLARRGGSGAASPWRWMGRGTAQLGLYDHVPAEDRELEAVLAGRHPGTGEYLLGHQGTNVAYEFTFAAPDVVRHFLHEFASVEPVVEDVRRCHEDSVTAAIDYLERCTTAHGLVGASFTREATSGQDGPTLETRVVLANLTGGVDGQWSLLDSQRVRFHAHSMTGLYYADLRLGLTMSDLWVGWRDSGRGLYELVDLDSEDVGPGWQPAVSRPGQRAGVNEDRFLERIEGLALVSRRDVVDALVEAMPEGMSVEGVERWVDLLASWGDPARSPDIRRPVSEVVPTDSELSVLGWRPWSSDGLVVWLKGLKIIRDYGERWPEATDPGQELGATSSRYIPVTTEKRSLDRVVTAGELDKVCRELGYRHRGPALNLGQGRNQVPDGRSGRTGR
jgi:hypothetical protein